MGRRDIVSDLSLLLIRYFFKSKHMVEQHAEKSVLSDSVYHHTSFTIDKDVDYDFLQISQSLGNFLAADWLTRSLQRKAAKRSHSFLTLRRLRSVCQSADSFQSRFFIHASNDLAIAGCTDQGI